MTSSKLLCLDIKFIVFNFMWYASLKDRWAISDKWILIRGQKFSLLQYSRVFAKRVNNQETSGKNNICSEAESHKEHVHE